MVKADILRLAERTFQMMISKGEKVHVATRRLFEEDLRRHFAGTVDEVSDVAFRATGYVFIFDQAKGEFVRRNQKRTQLFAIGDAGLIISVLPETVELDQLRYSRDRNGARTITDGMGFEMNHSEFGAAR